MICQPNITRDSINYGLQLPRVQKNPLFLDPVKLLFIFCFCQEDTEIISICISTKHSLDHVLGLNNELNKNNWM